jgi:hypothetical protein
MICSSEITKFERDKKNKIILQICLSLQFRSPEIGSLFSSPIYSCSCSSQRYYLLSKFEKAFEAIKKNDRDCKENLKRYNFRKPKKGQV